MNMKSISLSCALILGSSLANGASTTSNKAVEKKSEVSQQKTADAQIKGSDADVAVTRKIRDRLTDMDGLSMSAQNITIVTVGQNITLKGEVENQREIQTILNVAQEASAGKTISNQLQVHK